jgi:toxin YoeB
MRISFTTRAWEDYQHWVKTDKQVLRKLNRLIEDTLRHPASGIGKPEPLKHELAGHWSRRITDEHRMVYRVEDDTLLIVQCRYHY